jgi:ubiquinone/menaquinone biosynthesis C-methylase UbiE
LLADIVPVIICDLTTILEYKEMSNAMLTTEQARRVYDRIGSKQDTQAFYENAALDRLVAAADFKHARHAVEFGCGTGRFALRLLQRELPEQSTYSGFDLSSTMVGIARERLAPYGTRASVTQTDGSPRLPLADASCDRFVSTYVFDLLTGSHIEAVVKEAHRLLSPDGLLCITSLTHGQGMVSKSLMALWKALQRLSAPLVGGCRPIGVSQYVPADKWQVKLSTVLVRWGVPSEVFVARRLAPEETAAADNTQGPGPSACTH